METTENEHRKFELIIVTRLTVDIGDGDLKLRFRLQK